MFEIAKEIYPFHDEYYNEADNANAMIIATLRNCNGDTSRKHDSEQSYDREPRCVTMLKCSCGIKPINGKPTLGVVWALIFDVY